MGCESYLPLVLSGNRQRARVSSLAGWCRYDRVMALYGKSTMDKLIGSDHFSLSDLVKSFNNAINEEQAWAVCFQCAQFFLRGQPQEKYQDLYMFGSQALRLSKDGEVFIDCQSLTSKGSGKGPPDSKY